MITTFNQDPLPHYGEREKAGNAYAISMVVMAVALPLPIIGVLATIIYYFAQGKSTYYVRWNSLQAVFNQLVLLPVNSVAVYWTLYIIYFDGDFLNVYYWIYILLFSTLNIIEFVSTILTVNHIKDGKFVRWWIIGNIVDRFVKK
jgi:hypothetical protein